MTGISEDNGVVTSLSLSDVKLDSNGNFQSYGTISGQTGAKVTIGGYEFTFETGEIISFDLNSINDFKLSTKETQNGITTEVSNSVSIGDGTITQSTGNETLTTKYDSTTNKLTEIESITEGTDGVTIAESFDYDTDEKLTADTTTVTTDDFEIESKRTYAADGTLKSAEAEDVHVRMSKARAKELGLDVAGKTADQNGFYGFTAADAGAVLGSSFGTSLAGANQFKQVAYGSTLGVLGHDLGNWITSANSSTSTSSSSSIGAWLKNLPKRIGDQLAVTTQNVLVVIGVSEITKKLGLSNFAANTFTAATASAVNNVVTSITNGAKNVSQAVKAVNWSQALTAVSAYMGSYLASKVIEVKSKSAAIVQAAFTAVARSLLAPA